MTLVGPMYFINVFIISCFYKYFLHYIEEDHVKYLDWSEALCLGVLISMTDPIEVIEDLEE